MKFFDKYFEDFVGYLIIIHVLHQILILGTQIVVFSLLLIFSVIIHFLEKDLQPEAFGNILDSMWYGIATLTTVGYGDVTPVSDL